MRIKNSTYLLLFFTVGCSPMATKNNSATANELPDWLSAKPALSTYYVGIGHSSKKNEVNYIQQAKKNALEDIASAIKVTVSSTSTLSKMEDYQAFSEKYQQITKTVTSNELQEYEQVDAWEDDTNYWVYYRLSKERYRQIKEEQKNNAAARAMDFFTTAKQYERKGHNVQAIAFCVKALNAIERYLTQPLRLKYEGKEILLANEIYTSIQHLLDNIVLSAQPAKIILNRRGARNAQEMVIYATHKNSNKPIVALPLNVTFEKGGGDILPHYTTNTEGKSRLLINKITSKATEQMVGVKVDMLRFAGDKPTAIYALLADKMIVPSTNIVLTVQHPTVYVTAVEREMGRRQKMGRVANRIENYLTDSGFALTNNRGKAELWVDINVNSEKGPISGSLYTAYVTVALKVVDLREREEIYTVTLDKIKDYSLDYERANRAAHSKSLEKLEKTVLPELLNAILQ